MKDTYIPTGDWQEDLLLEIEQGTIEGEAFIIIASRYNKIKLCFNGGIPEVIKYIKKVYFGE